MILLRSIIFNLAFYVWSVLSAIIHIYTLLLPKRFLVRAQWRWGRDVNFLMKHLAGIEVEIRGAERLPPLPYLVASKHQSAWDTIIFLHVLDAPAIVLKSILAWIPVYGQMCLKARMIIVNRKAGAKALRKMIADAKAAAGAGRPIMIFPQGTRTRPEASVAEAPYQPGVMALYKNLDIPLVPVALNSGLFWPRRQFTRYPGKIVLEFLEPIPPGLKRKEFTAVLQQRIEEGTAKLVAEAGGEQ